MKHTLYFFIAFTVPLYGHLVSGPEGLPIAQQVVDFNESTAKSLLEISKKYNDAQAVIYKTLDHVNRLSSACKDEAQRKEDLRQLVSEEKKQKNLMLDENSTLKKKIASLEKELTNAEKKIEAHLSDLHQVRKEKDDLSSKNQSAADKEKEYLKKMEVFEKSLQQVPQHIAEERDKQQEK